MAALPALWLASGVLGAIGLALGWWATHWSAERVGHDGPLTRLRAWERGGDGWMRIGVHRWKDDVPEAGALFGGEAKRRLRSARDEDLVRFVGETRRAERVHWLHASSGPLFGLAFPAPIAVAMVISAVLFNAPFIVIQRYNRGRLLRILARRERRDRPRQAQAPA